VSISYPPFNSNSRNPITTCPDSQKERSPRCDGETTGLREKEKTIRVSVEVQLLFNTRNLSGA